MERNVGVRSVSVFQVILESTSLSESDRQALLDRGLRDEEINRNQYRSFSGDIEEQIRIGKNLFEKFGNMIYQTPGVFKGDIDGETKPMFVTYKGLAIPCRHRTGGTFLLRIRSEYDGKKQYLYASSSKRGGPPVPNRIHFPKNFDKTSSLIGITEGPLKADVATSLGEISWVGLPSVGQMDCLKETRSLCKNVTLGFDQDLHQNEQVARHTIKAFRYILQQFENVTLCKWDSNYKGIDDALKNNAELEFLTKEDAIKFLENVAKKHGLPRINWYGSLDSSIFLEPSEIEWGEIKPIDSILEPERIAGDLIPEFFRDFAIKVSKNMQSPIEYLLIPMLSLLSSMIGANVKIRPKVNDCWTTYLNLWALLIGKPSSFKSPTLKMVMKFLEKYQKEEDEKYEAEYLEYKKEVISLDIENKAIEASLTKLYKSAEKDHKKIEE